MKGAAQHLLGCCDNRLSDRSGPAYLFHELSSAQGVYLPPALRSMRGPPILLGVTRRKVFGGGWGGTGGGC